MATACRTEDRSGGCLIAVLIIAAVIAAIAVPVLNQHAWDRHGQHAVSALRQVQNYTPDPGDDDGRCWIGTDANGRTCIVVRLDALLGKPTTWAIVIVTGGVLVTAFLVQSPRTVERMKEKCR